MSRVNFYPSSHHTVHILLNLQQIQHPHTGEMLAKRRVQTLNYWAVSESKVLTMVTDYGGNVVKAIMIAREFERDSQERETHEETDNTD
jgi:hypothetical protein